jgi:hypothetical protein
MSIQAVSYLARCRRGLLVADPDTGALGQLPRRERVVLKELCRRLGQDRGELNGGAAWPSVDAISSATSYARRTVQLALSELQARGLVKRSARRGTCSLTHMHPALLDAVERKAQLTILGRLKWESEGVEVDQPRSVNAWAKAQIRVNPGVQKLHPIQQGRFTAPGGDLAVPSSPSTRVGEGVGKSKPRSGRPQASAAACGRGLVQHPRGRGTAPGLVGGAGPGRGGTPLGSGGGSGGSAPPEPARFVRAGAFASIQGAGLGEGAGQPGPVALAGGRDCRAASGSPAGAPAISPFAALVCKNKRPARRLPALPGAVAVGWGRRGVPGDGEHGLSLLVEQGQRLCDWLRVAGVGRLEVQLARRQLGEPGRPLGGMWAPRAAPSGLDLQASLASLGSVLREQLAARRTAEPAELYARAPAVPASRVLVLDDLLEGAVDLVKGMGLAHACIKTSPGSHHVLLLAPQQLAAEGRAAAQRALARRLGGDPAAADAGRLWRLPGSLNWKRVGGPRPLPETSELVSLLGVEQGGRAVPAEWLGGAPYDAPVPSEAAPWEAAAGDRGAFGDASAADMAWAWKAALAGVARAEVERELERRGAARGKPRPAYYARLTSSKVTCWRS